MSHPPDGGSPPYEPRRTQGSVTIQTSSQPAWRRIVGTLAGVFLGIVLLVAAWAKMLDPTAFAEQIRLEGLDFLLPAGAVVLIALALEVGLGSALVLGIRRWWVLGPAAALVAFFVFLTGRTYWLSAHGLLDEAAASCGCFGNLVDRTPAQAFWQDTLLLIPPLLLALLGTGATSAAGKNFPRLRTGVVGALAVATVLFAWKAPQLPLDDLATRLKPGVDTAEVCAGGEGAARVCLTTILPELASGRHWVVLADLDEGELAAAVPAMNEYTYSGGALPLWVVSDAEPEVVNRFYWQTGPAFPVREAPTLLLRPLYRRLPRSFLVEDGTVRQTFSGLPPWSRDGTDQQPEEGSSDAGETVVFRLEPSVSSPMPGIS